MVNGVDARWLKTNPSCRKKELVREGQGGTERGKAGGGGRKKKKKTIAPLYLIFLKGYSSQWSTVRLPACISVGDSNSCQTHLCLEMEKWPIMKSHRQTVGNQRHMNLLCPMKAKTFLAKSSSY